MKTSTAALLAVFMLLPWCATIVRAQVPATPAEKKITIRKHYVRPDGTVEEESIIKNGKAAETFDIEAYLKENDQPGVSVSITEESADGEYRRSIQRDGNRSRQVARDVEKALEEAGRAVDIAVNEVRVLTDDGRGFLGVQVDSDEDPEEEGLIVEIVRCSAAAAAGLKSNDKIMSINGIKIDRWSDLNNALKGGKPGDRVDIRYERNGKADKVEAVLTTRKAAYASDCTRNQRGYMGISPDGGDGGKPGVKVRVSEGSAAEKAGMQDGDRIILLDDQEIRDWEDIEDFMSDTQAGRKVVVSFSRDGKRYAKEIILDEKAPMFLVEGLEDLENMNFNFDNWDWNDVEINEREKSTCLGVYSSGEENGARITEFTESSAAREADMQVGDMITAVNGQAVKSHDDLWDEIAKYQPGDVVEVQVQRNEQNQTVNVTLKACQDQNKVSIITKDDAGSNEARSFYTWKWGTDEEQRLRRNQVITIHRGEDGDQPAASDTPQQPAADRKLELRSFKAYPNPTSGPLTVEFSAKAEPVIVSLLDLSGRQLFREELNAFNGNYRQQFDLSEYAKGTVVVQIIQSDQVFTEQLVVN
jgi:S1-C subfamily serine protease